MLQLSKLEVSFKKRISTVLVTNQKRFFFFCCIYRCHARMKIDSANRLAFMLEGHNHIPMLKLNSNIIDVTGEVEEINTTRGGVSLLHQGIKFVRCSQTNDITRYRCQYHSNKCKCRIFVDGKGIAKMRNFHNHDLLAPPPKRTSFE